MIITVPKPVTLPEGTRWRRIEDHGDTMTVDISGPYADELRERPMKIAARLATEDKIKNEELDDETIAELAPLYDPWLNEQGTEYIEGELRSWDGTVIQCRQTHTHNDTNHTPDITPALWKIYRTVEAGAEWVANEQVWKANDVNHPTEPNANAATVRSYQGTEYRCIQSHITQVGWEPPNTPSLWEVNQ